jgi:alpha-ketoglutarate-dependent taurine dioxygenase
MPAPKFRRVTPKGVSLAEELVETAALAPGARLPLVLSAKAPDLDLSRWAEARRPLLEARLLEHGALLFRGFGVATAGEFERFSSAVAGELYGEYGDLPREQISGKVYGATVYPENQPILFHNEASHTASWPLKIFFHCQVAPRSGGETNLADCREIHRALAPSLREKLAGKGLLYLRSFHPGLDVSWQEYFRTTSRALVERHCAESGIDWEWTGEDQLKTRERRPAIRRHPATGDSVFFNQIQLHHPSCLEPALRESLASVLPEESWPRNVFYGDGSRIEDEVVSEIAALFAERRVGIAWNAGDVLMVDNMLTAHGRNPYLGPRRIGVAMGQMQRGA